MNSAKPLVLTAENAMSGIVLKRGVTISPTETIGQLLKRVFPAEDLPKHLEYKVIGKDGSTPLKSAHNALKNLKECTALRLLPVRTKPSFVCAVCKGPLYEDCYRSRVTSVILCPKHYGDLPVSRHKYFQQLHGPPGVKSGKACNTCAKPAWGDAYYVTPTGDVFCEKHALQFGTEAVKLCQRVTAEHLTRWRTLSRGAADREDRYRYKDDGIKQLIADFRDEGAN